MTDEQVFELAERNSFQDDSGCWIFKDEGLLDFVFMVQKAEREACAKVCESMERNGAWITKAEAAEAIRERRIDGARVGEVGMWGKEKNGG